MLRWLLAIVLLLNLAFYAWSHGWLAQAGLAPVLPDEPERVQQQIRPEVITVKKDIPANVPASAASEASEPAASAAADN